MKTSTGKVAACMCLLLFSLLQMNVRALPTDTVRHVYISGTIPGVGFKTRFPAAIRHGRLYVSDDVVLDSSLYRIVPDSGLSVIFGNGVEGGMSDGTFLWPDGVMPYEIEKTITGGFRQNILDVIKEVNDKTNICMIPRINQEHFVRFVPDEVENECGHSNVGCLRAGMQEIALKDWFCGKGTIRHEIMHAIGFNHEHQRPDRDEHIEVVRDNIDLSDADFEIAYGIQGENVGNYDKHSVMHYGHTSNHKWPCLGDGCVTMRSLDEPGFEFNNDEYSSGDVRSINKLYPIKAQKDCACERKFKALYHIDTIDMFNPASTQQKVMEDAYATYLEPQPILFGNANVVAYYHAKSGTLRTDKFNVTTSSLREKIRVTAQLKAIKGATIFRAFVATNDTVYFVLYRPAFDSVFVRPIGGPGTVSIPPRLFIYTATRNAITSEGNIPDKITVFTVIPYEENISMIEIQKIQDQYYYMQYNSSTGNCRVHRMPPNALFANQRTGFMVFNQLMGTGFRIVKFFSFNNEVYFYRSRTSGNFQRIEKINPNCSFCSNDPGTDVMSTRMAANYNRAEFFTDHDMLYRLMYNSGNGRFRIDRMIQFTVFNRSRIMARNLVTGNNLTPDWYKYYRVNNNLFLSRITR